MSLRSVLSSAVIVLVVTLLLWLWFRPAYLTHQAEEPPPPTTVASVEPPTPAPSIPPPTAREAQDRLDVCFRNTLELVEPTTPLLSGDFNADSSMDLAMVVKPKNEAQLAELNGEFPGWIVQDLSVTFKGSGPPPAVKVAATDRLLVIIHGYQAEGWRNPDARQAHLFKNAVGDSIKVVPLKSAVAALGDQAKDIRPGQALSESLGGRPGFLMWMGSRYVWRPSPGNGK